MSLVIVDVGCGNIGSVGIAFERFGLAPQVTGDPAAIAAAGKVVLPGVGAAGYAMEQIRRRGLVAILKDLRQPVLGMCLGIVPGRVRRLEPAPGRPVPHMGWSRLEVSDPSLGLADGDYVYFAHSFACDDGPATAARADYGRPIPAAVRSANFTGVQFHPERSGEAGARFLEAWLSS